MAINFPDSPSLNDEFTDGGHTWIWDGTKWVSSGADLASAIEAGIAAYFAENPVASFDSGTKLVAAQTTAPTGWTKDTTHNNKALRLVTGTVGTGGSSPFTTAFASRTPTGSTSSDSLSTAQLASHQHSKTTESGATVDRDAWASTGGTPRTTRSTNAEGSGSTHSHTLSAAAMDFAVEYVDVVIITKD